jgi:hypothetical protein
MPRIFKKVVSDSSLWTFFLVFVGAVASVRWQIVAVVSAGAFVIRGIYLFWQMRRDVRDARRRAARFVALRSPDRQAVLFAAQHGHKEVVVGSVIEIWSHHSLESMLLPTKLGIAPSSVSFRQQSHRNFDNALRRCGGLRPFDPPNQKKFGIAKLPLGTTDDENFIVEFYETDFNTWMSVRTVIECDPELRRELSNVDPDKSLIPQSMSLQFVVRFADGDILTMKRKDGLHSEPGTWSISAEEQLHERDFRSGTVDPAEHLFRRAFIEEILGKRATEDESLLQEIWNEACAPLMDSYRIWSFFLEERTGLFQTFGVFQLNIRASDLRQIHERAISSGWGTTDPEGHLYILRANDIPDLLLRGECEVHRLHGDPERRLVKVGALHPTARYRLWQLYRALHRTEAHFVELRLGDN